jgi:uncharacterized LabA/DUF88 family protein
MPERIRIFVDFWNLQLQWNRTTNSKKIDWPKLPQILLNKTELITGIKDYQYDGTKVYSSVDMTTSEGGKLKGWLKTFLDRQPGINVYIRERKPHLKPIHCKNCNKEIDDCPFCNEPLKRAAEKGIDSAIITDMFSLAWANAYSMAILVTSDADYVPAVENLQAKGLKVINAAWRNIGFELSGTCWASFNIDDLVSSLER